ncbi:MAG: hypothetical protein ACYC63_20485, partial [Armatimonadota bacterium]
QILEEEMPRPAVLWREGHEFRDQAKAEALAGGTGKVRVRVPRWVWLVMEALRELRLHEATGQLSGGGCWSEQPAWKVELWEAFWSGRLSRGAAGEREGL